MTQDTPLDQPLEFLASKLRSRAAWVRRQALDELAGVDFEQFERPPQLTFLLAAMNALELRDRARESLTRMLRGLDPGELENIAPDDRKMLRASIKQSRPQSHAEFLIEVARALLKIGDTDSIPVLGDLVERTTIRQYMARDYRNRGTTTHLARTFEGTPVEEHNVRQVRTAAHVAFERLMLMAENAARGTLLLHPAPPPEPDDLLRPAGESTADPTVLLRPSDTSARPDVTPVDVNSD